jgi:hypothetical protein
MELEDGSEKPQVPLGLIPQSQNNQPQGNSSVIVGAVYSLDSQNQTSSQQQHQINVPNPGLNIPQIPLGQITSGQDVPQPIGTHTQIPVPPVV